MNQGDVNLSICRGRQAREGLIFVTQDFNMFSKSVGDLRVWDQIYWDTMVLLDDVPCIFASFSHRLVAWISSDFFESLLLPQ